MTARWSAKAAVPPSGPSPVIGERQDEGTVLPSPFENLVPPEPVSAELEEAKPVTPDAAETSQEEPTEPELAMFPTEYAAVTRRERCCPSCVFVPADGQAFGRHYGELHGIDWLPNGAEGFTVCYMGSAVEVRGRRLWPLFLALNDQRACAVRQFDPDRWQLPPSGPVVTDITAKNSRSL